MFREDFLIIEGTRLWHSKIAGSNSLRITLRKKSHDEEVLALLLLTATELGYNAFVHCKGKMVFFPVSSRRQRPLIKTMRKIVKGGDQLAKVKQIIVESDEITFCLA